jgi:hypothetical protein
LYRWFASTRNAAQAAPKPFGSKTFCLAALARGTGAFFVINPLGIPIPGGAWNSLFFLGEFHV